MIERVDLAGPEAGEVLVRIVASGVCQTDAFTLSGANPDGLFPTILGHEGAGIVEEIGSGVTSVRAGDHVILLYMPECGTCEACLSNKTNQCTRLRATQELGLMQDGTTRFSLKGKPILHYMGTSSFSEHVVLPEIAVARINSAAPLTEVCLLGCVGTAGIGAVLNTAQVSAGSTVAVFGLGGVGLSVIQGAVMARAARIIAVDLNPVKWTLAKALGATDYVNPKEHHCPIQAVILEMTRGGVDYSFECIGNGHTMRAGLECCRLWRGSGFGGVKGRSQLPAYVDRYLEGSIEIKPLISRVLPLEKINNAFDLVHEGSTIRTVIGF